MATNLQFIKSASGTSVSSLSVTDCFSATYDVYEVTATFDKSTSASNWSSLRFIDSGGSVISASEYDYASLTLLSYASFPEEKGTSQTGISRVNFLHTSLVGGDTKFTIYNPYDSSSYTFTNFQNVSSTSGNMFGGKVIGVHKSAEQITGLNIVGDSAYTFDNITVNVYGVK